MEIKIERVLSRDSFGIDAYEEFSLDGKVIHTEQAADMEEALSWGVGPPKGNGESRGAKEVYSYSSVEILKKPVGLIR